NLTTGANNSTTQFDGLIAGAGGLIKSGTGKFTLTAANTYTGGTSVTGGTLSISNDNQLGGAAGGVTLNSGALQTITAGLTSGRNFTVGVNNGTFDSNSLNSTLTGSLGGTGTLYKVGGGDLTVKHVRSGALNVMAGNVVVAAGRLAAHTSNDATVTVAPGSKLDLNDEDLIVSGETPSAVQAKLAASYAGGAWTGPGAITSSAAAAAAASAVPTALGFGLASDILNSPTGGTFSGQTVGGSAVLVAYTASGDAN